MDEFWISLKSIPVTGATQEYSSQPVWNNLLKEIGPSCRGGGDMQAVVTILPQESGVLFRGSVTGSIILPCDRCAEESTFLVDEHFDIFEPLPNSEPEENIDLAEAHDAIIRPAPFGDDFEINPLATAWEELCLALPVKPLCNELCKGLCSNCGANMNTAPCNCDHGTTDPRLALLRGLKVTR